MQLHTTALISARQSFIWLGLTKGGEVVVRKKFSRNQLLHFTANLQVELIGIEACGGSRTAEDALRTDQKR